MTDLARTLAAALPDAPRWIDIRGMLLSGHARILGGTSVESGFAVVVTYGAVSSIGVVGTPPLSAIREAVADVTAMTPVVCQTDGAPHVRRVLTGWAEEPAIIHTLPKGAELKPRVRAPKPDLVRLLAREEDSLLTHLPSGLRHEMTGALALGPVAAAFVDGRPVSFCYPVWRTERWWDVSIDTLEPYRRRGYAVAAMRLMTREMRATGREPIWSALASNLPSLRLAAKLGFGAVDGIVVFSRDGRWTLLSGGFEEDGGLKPSTR